MKVSVVIPCYNGEDYIGQAIGSLLNQTRPANEIIVVDDGSTDRSAEIAQNFGQTVTILSKEGGDAANARNCGADHATGDAIMFLDADDVLSPDVLEQLIDQLEKNPDGVVACPWHRLVKIENKWVKKPPTCKPLGDNEDYLSGWLTGWYHLPCSILWSRTAYKNRGGWDPRAYVNDDGDLMMRALADGVNLQITEKGASFYRRMPDEQLSDSLSGARFTRKGRKAQIYVVHKIAQMLEDRGRLNNYRKPITVALEQYRDKCQLQYPDLSERCSELIGQFGEPRYIQFARHIKELGYKAVRSIRIWLRLGRLKKKVFMKIRGNNHSARQPDKVEYEEIEYGLDTYQKFKKIGEKSNIKKPLNPAVSVILPLTDDVDAFNKSLESVLNQELQNFELIVTGRESSVIIKSDIGKLNDARIRVAITKNNGETTALLNHGLKNVKGNNIAFIDPGDVWLPEKLTLQTDCFQKAAADVGLVYTGIESIDNKGHMTEFLPIEKGNVYNKLLHQNIINCRSSVMIRRTVIPAIGFFDPNLPDFQNHDFWLRISRFFKFDFIEDTLVRCQTRNIGRKSKKIDNGKKSRQLFIDKYQREIKLTNTGKTSVTV